MELRIDVSHPTSIVGLTGIISPLLGSSKRTDAQHPSRITFRSAFGLSGPGCEVQGSDLGEELPLRTFECERAI